MATSEKFKRNILRIIPAIAIAATLSACTAPDSSRNAQRTTHSEPRMLNGSSDSLAMASQDEFEQLVQSVDTKSKIMNQYANWKGVRYRLGGTTKVVLIVQALCNVPLLNNLVLPYHVRPQSKSLPVRVLTVTI